MLICFIDKNKQRYESKFVILQMGIFFHFHTCGLQSLGIRKKLKKCHFWWWKKGRRHSFNPPFPLNTTEILFVMIPYFYLLLGTLPLVLHLIRIVIHPPIYTYVCMYLMFSCYLLFYLYIPLTFRMKVLVCYSHHKMLTSWSTILIQILIRVNFVFIPILTKFWENFECIMIPPFWRNFQISRKFQEISTFRLFFN